MDQKAHTVGSIFPPLKKGLLRLYSMRFCPYSQRVRLVLNAKNIQY
jgi:glutathione S-transferase